VEVERVEKRPRVSDTSSFVVDDDDDDDEADYLSYEPSASSSSAAAAEKNLFSTGLKPGQSLDGYFDRKESVHFYEEEAACKGHGYKSIVGKALYPESPTDAALLSDIDIELHIDIAILLDTLPSTHHERLFSVLKQTDINGLKRGLVENKEFVCRATSFEQRRAIYLDGRNAILKNLPQPKVETIGNYAYISLREAIRDLLANDGTNLDTFSTTVPDGYKPVFVEKLSESKWGRQMQAKLQRKYRFKVLPLYIIKWSDGYDPFNNKTNRGSHWIMTMSFSPPEHREFHTDNTYVIAAGPDKESHLPVIEKIRQEWKDMESKVDQEFFYYGKEKEFVHVSLSYMAVVQDSPERTSDSMTPACNSRFGRYFGSSYDYNTCWSKIKACDSCKKQFDGKYDVTRTPILCDICTCWDLNPKSSLLAFKPMETFPKEEVPLGGLLPPLTLEFSVLIEKYKHAYGKLMSKSWSDIEMKSFCSYHGMKPEWQEKIIVDCNTKWEVYEIFMNNPILNEVVRNELVELNVEYLFKFTQEQLLDYFNSAPPPPPTWDSGYSFEDISPSTMHALSLNCGKNTIKLVRQLLVVLSSETAFHRHGNEVTMSLMNLGLPWLKMLEWYRRGGYVSENWLALIRIFKYFNAAASSLTQKYKYEEPKKDINKWTKKEKVTWLKARAVKIYDNTLLADVDIVFNAEQAKPADEQLTVLTKRNFDPQIITKVTSSYFGFVGTVLCKRTEEGVTSKECEWRVKQFLSSIDELGSVYQEVSPKVEKTDGLPVWCTTFSFLNLLSFPKALEQWGPLRNLWEGGVMGEGLLRYIKPLVPRTGSHIFRNVLQRFYVNRAISRYKQGRKKEEGEIKNSECEYVEQNCHVYKNIDEVRFLIEKHLPLCVVRLHQKDCPSNGRFVVLLKKPKEEQNMLILFPYVALSINCTRFCGTFFDCPFFDWTITDFGVTSIDTSTYVFQHSCLLLPSMAVFNVPFKSYYTITSEWLEMTPDGTFKRGDQNHNT
jgi:hypothetical protein